MPTNIQRPSGGAPRCDRVTYEPVGPAEIATILEALLARGSATPDGLAYAVGDDAITYRALLADALGLAGVLAARGLARHSRCALILPSGLDFIRAIYAIQAVGAVPVAINSAFPPDLVLRRVRLVRAHFAIASSDAVAALQREAGGASPCRIEAIDDLLAARSPGLPMLAPPRPEDPAFLQITSGTTGEPRAAVVDHRSLLAWLIASRSRLAIRPDDVFATWVPLHHDMGLVRFVFGALFWGCASHLVAPSIANLRRWLETITRVRATVTASPDFGYRIAARTVDPRGLDLTSLRFATNGGEPVRLSTIEDFEHRFGLVGVIRPAYGLAEATLGVTSVAPDEPLRVDAAGTVSCGRPLAGVELRIANDHGRNLPPGATGEILVRGQTLFRGYFDDESATRETLRGGWLHTGDVGAVDEEGHLFVKGRARALIKRAGATLAPREIEEAVDRINGVRLSAAVGVPRDSVCGTEEIVVVVEIQPAAAPSETARAALAVRIEQAAVRAVGTSPGRVLLVVPRTIPRTPSGKTRYDELRGLVASATFGGRLLFTS